MVSLHQHESRDLVPLVGDRKMRVLAVGEGVTDVALAQGLDELEAHVGHIVVAATGGGSVGDC